MVIINKEYKQQIFNNVQKIIHKYLPESKEEIKPQEGFEIIKSTKVPMIFVVSDVHLGALKSNVSLFKEFLKAIRTNQLGEQARALIINGDFFDLCMDSFEDLSKDYQEIYNELGNLQEKDDFTVIFILGNHEIPITNDYNREFYSRKKDFLRKFKTSFKNNDLNTEILNKDYFCQYVTLSDNYNKWELNLFDHINQVKPNNDKPIIVEEESMNLDKNYLYLFTHGYQFEDEKDLQFCSDIWASAIEMPDPIKELGNLLWNGIIHCGVKASDILDGIIEKVVDKEPTIDDIIKNKKERKKPTYKILKKFLSFMRYCESRLERSTNDKYNQNITDKFLLSKLTHVIFGHTHIKQIADFGNIAWRKKLKIINDGTWQKVLRPSFVEVYSDGDVNIMEFFKDSSDKVIKTVWNQKVIPPPVIS